MINTYKPIGIELHNNVWWILLEEVESGRVIKVRPNPQLSYIESGLMYEWAKKKGPSRYCAIKHLPKRTYYLMNIIPTDHHDKLYLYLPTPEDGNIVHIENDKKELAIENSSKELIEF